MVFEFKEARQESQKTRLQAAHTNAWTYMFLATRNGASEAEITNALIVRTAKSSGPNSREDEYSKRVVKGVTLQTTQSIIDQLKHNPKLLEQEVNTIIPFESICTTDVLSTLLPKLDLLELSTLAQTNKEYGAETHNVIRERWRLSRSFVHLRNNYRAYKRVVDAYRQLDWDYTCPFIGKERVSIAIKGKPAIDVKWGSQDSMKTLEHSTAPHKAVKGDFILSVVVNNRLVPQKEPLSYLVKREENRVRRENSRKERMKYSSAARPR